MTASTTSFDPVWEDKYADGQGARYPWDAVVSFVFRNAPRGKSRSDFRVLELGCGTAPNLWFAAREGFDVAGVDASASAIATAKQRFAEDGLDAGGLHVANFTELPFANDSFDLAIDRAALTCCGFAMARRATAETYRVLKPGGRFFFNVYSDRHSSYSPGRQGADGCVQDITEGSLTGVGQICFYGRQQIESALRDFRIVSLQHVETAEMEQPGCWIHAEWRVVTEKL